MKQTKPAVQWTAVWISSRKAVLAFEAGGAYQTAPYSVRIASRDGVRQFTSDKMVLTIDALLPDTGYDLEASRDGVPFATVHLRTAQESAVLNVRKFGAAGDGTRDDTLAIQAAISCCPPQGIVRIPAGRYAVTSLFLKSNTTIELEENAVLLGATRREDLAIVPGMLPCWDDTQEVNLGSWEGNPLPMFTAMLHGQDVENVAITGKGILDGQASYENWWHGFRQIRGAYRPRMVFLNRCRNVLLEGFTTRNSPAWNLHPYFSDDVKLLNLTVENPKISPNTDGLDIESCRRTLVQRVHFSVGDDCIAVKSGKIYMGQRYKRPTEDLIIRNCLMENGHGGVTIGSEIAAGAQRVLVQDCVFRGMYPKAAKPSVFSRFCHVEHFRCFSGSKFLKIVYFIHINQINARPFLQLQRTYPPNSCLHSKLLPSTWSTSMSWGNVPVSLPIKLISSKIVLYILLTAIKSA